MQFSVLMSIYHKENPQHFDECMQSIWHEQILKPDQIVLVKDGELTKALDDVIKQWQQHLGSIFTVVALPTNQGTGKAKNIGLTHCLYEIVCVVDTDDICDRHRFKKQLEFFASHPETTVVGGQIYEFVQNIKNVTGSRQVPLTHQALTAFAKRQSPFNHMTVAYKKQAVLAVGGYQHHWYMEDYNLFLRLIAGGAILYNLPDYLVYARIDNGMHARRRGFRYLLSEWQLYRLKTSLKLQNPIMGLVFFVLRALPRLLPAILLTKVYQLLRHSPPK